MASHSFTSMVDLRYGLGAVSQVGDILTDAQARNVLVVADKGIRAAGLVDRLTEQFGAGVSFEVFDEVGAEVSDVEIMSGVDVFKATEPDVVIGLGGGSSMDGAKAIRAVAEAGGVVNDYEGFNEFHGVVPKSGLICIATTSGTGSEVGCWSMVVDSQRHTKMALADSVTLMPTVSIVDPELAISLPARFTAETGMDAFCHAMETYVARSSSPVTDALSLHAMRLVGRSLKKAWANGDDVEARADMAYASMIAGVSINNVDCGAVHALGETVGPRYGLSHGRTMAAFMPYVMKSNAGTVPEKMVEIARSLGVDVNAVTSSDAPDAAWRAVAGLAGQIGIPRPSSFGIDRATFAELARACLDNPSSAGNPRPLDEAAYVELLEQAVSTDLW